MSVTSAFVYRAQDTPLHRMDPRAKLVVTVALVGALWMRLELLVLLLILVPIVLLLAAAHLWRDVKGSLRAYLLLGLVVVPLNAVLFAAYAPPASGGVSPSESLTSTVLLSGIPLTVESLRFSVALYLRLVLMLLAISLFILTTSPDALQALLLNLRAPAFFVLTLGFAFRFLPTFAVEAQRIQEAQKARGLELRRGNVFRRYWRAIVPLVMPLLTSVLRKSVRFAEALEVRGTFATPRRTSVTQLVFQKRDALAVGVAGGLFLLALMALVVVPIS